MRTETISNPRRRGLLGGAVALLAAGAAGAAASAAPINPTADAEWIRLCNRLVDIAKEENALFDASPNEDVPDALLIPLGEETRKIEDRLWDLDNPVTMEGIAATARAALAHAPRDTVGNIHRGDHCLAEMLAFAAVEAIAEAHA